MRSLAFVFFLVAGSAASATPSRFACKASGGGGNYRPYYLKTIAGSDQLEDFSKKPKGLLGQNAMRSLQECERAVAGANAEFGVICSRTGLDGYKPTLYTGTSPGRADFGYLGGSTIDSFADCLQATMSASKKGVCFWGGSDWWVSPIDREGIVAGPFRTLDACTARTTPKR